MLQLKNIRKQYHTGEFIQTALDGINLNLRNSEFVAVLGPSGSGKTTLLNIIGGLDRYDEGDLIINGRSTKEYKDRDWDSYRNHSIGFVFQSYHLILHQSVLSNVELALTISGIGKRERRERAKHALTQVGLNEHMHKKPTQLSGGQMQRVAIARALVNNPDILLADEPTGALDSGTSIQIMELLKEVAKDRLVVMVTHNPELAQQYASRIVTFQDGRVLEDTSPYQPKQDAEKSLMDQELKKASMSFATSLSLSFQNLWTKKGRTILTSFAGSIGIIGIALILSLSTGVNTYIDDMQRETMTSYPITIRQEEIDLGSIIASRRWEQEDELQQLERTGIYSNHDMIESDEPLASKRVSNNLESLKRYLENPEGVFQKKLASNEIVYAYEVRFDVYVTDEDENTRNTNLDSEKASQSSGFGEMMGMRNSMLSGSVSSDAENFEELTVGNNDLGIHQGILDSYEILNGHWPNHSKEVVLVLDEYNRIPTVLLYQLGFLTTKEYEMIKKKAEEGEQPEELSWKYEEAIGHTFLLVPRCNYFTETKDGLFSFTKDSKVYEEQWLMDAFELNIVGIIRPKKDAANANLNCVVAYSSALTNELIVHTNQSAVIKAQENSPQINVLSGLSFQAKDEAAKRKNAKEYLNSLSVSEKASFYTMLIYRQSETMDSNGSDQSMRSWTAEDMNVQMGSAMEEVTLAAALDDWLMNSPDDTILLAIYDKYLNESSYEDNMLDFGKVDYAKPYSISIYADSFENKAEITKQIEQYNRLADEENQIVFTDYIALLTESVTSMVNVVTYVLIAFVAVSLVVSCIMIGIITHISVLERTKEIGILRAIGASKNNIAQVFNAETVIIGLFSGILGVVLSFLLTIPMNAIIHSLIDRTDVRAVLPVTYGLLLIIISVVITVIGGLLPAKNAARKDPVIALRTE